jgi:hypothetical protein
MDVSHQKGNGQEKQSKEETRIEKLSVYRYLRHPFPSQITFRMLSENTPIYTYSYFGRA